MPRYDDRPSIGAWLFRLTIIVVLLAGLGFLAFAFIGDLSVRPQPVSVPVPLGGS